ncbi:MAG: hypothetical protein ACXWOL_05465 [Ktedonobacteraceae bacterium]
MSVEQPHHALTQKEAITFAIVSSVGAAALVLGLVLIISANYHERAYIFLILGAGGFMGGLAGVIVGGQKVRTVLDYGLIAMGFVGIVVGFNYLISQYGPEPNLAHGYLVIPVSTIAILTGVIGELIVQSKYGFAGILSVFVLGVIGSMGIAMLLVGMVYLAVLEHHKHAYFLLVLGLVCLVGGIVGGIVAQRRALTIRR